MPELKQVQRKLGGVRRALLVLGLAAAIVLQAAAPAFASFGVAANTTVGTTPSAVATGDFNRDGKIDLAVADAGSSKVAILLGNGAGGFTAGALVNVGHKTNAIVAADLNGDGKLDLAVTSPGSGTLTILLGNGAGGFTGGSAVGATLSTDEDNDDTTVALTAADLNGDGRIDIAVVNKTKTSVFVFLGNGVGGFAAPVSYPAGPQPSGVVAGDFNGDGKPDLAVSNSGGANVSVLLNSGSGTFTPGGTVGVGLAPSGLAIGNVNGDGRPDLVVANKTSNTVSVLLGNGSGGFTLRSSPATGTGPAAIVLADFNGDGKLDVATANRTTNNVSVLIGDGTGLFAPWALSPFGTGTTPIGMAASDLNGDGAIDLVTANSGSHNISVLLNQAATSTSVSSSRNPATAGETVTFTATVIHAIGSITLTGTVAFKDGTGIIGSGTVAAGVATFATSGLAAGTHSITAVYSGDPNYASSTSTALSQVVSSIPSAGLIHATPNPADATQTVALSANPSGGTGALTYAWSLTSKPGGSLATLSSATATAPTFVADLAGAYGVRLVVTDSHGVSSSPSLATVNANAVPGTPVVTITPSPADVGQTASLSATISGGTAPFSYSWSFTSTPGGSTATLSSTTVASPTFVPNVSGSYTVQLVVTDANGISAAPAFATVIVNNSPVSGAIAASPNPAETGQTVALSASPAGGTGTYSYAWSLTSRPATSAAALSSTSAAAPTLVPDFAGSYTVRLVVTDSNGIASSPSLVTITVSAAPQITAITAAPPVGEVGQTETLTATVTGGLAPYAYVWAIVSAPAASTATLSDPTLAAPSFLSDKAGTYQVSLVVTDSNGVSSSTVFANITVNAALSAGTITAAPPSPVAGTLVTLSSSPSDGVPPYSYAWSIVSAPAGSLATLTSATAASPKITPRKAGTYVFGLQVTDALGVVATATNLSVSVIAGNATTLTVTGFPTTATTGVSGSFTVTAFDAYGNTATGYTGTVHFSSTDSSAVLPADSTLTSGTGTFTATFNTAATQSLTGTDTATSSITGTESGINVGSSGACTIIWTEGSSTSSDWTDPANWNLNRIPSAADVACLLLSGDLANITTGSQTVMGVNIQGTLNIVGGGLTLTDAANPSSIANLTLTAGTIGGAAEVDITSMSWTGGQVGAAGDGGTMVLVSGGTLSISGSADHNLGTPHTLTLNGTTNWTGGRLHVTGTGLETITNGGAFSELLDGNVDVDAGASALFNNPGTFSKDVTTGVAMFAPAFHNTGHANVKTGTLVLTGGDGGVGANGPFTISGGAVLDLRGGTFRSLSANGGSSSVLVVSGAAVTWTAVGSGFTGIVNVSGGTLSIGSALNLSLASIALSGGRLGGPGSITGNTNWSGGTLGGGGGTFASANLLIVGSEHDFAAPYTVNLTGPTSWSGGIMRALSPTRGGFQLLRINNSGTFTILGNQLAFNLDCCLVSAVFVNTGTLVNNPFSSTSQTSWQVAMFNTNQVNVIAGTLTLSGGDGVSLVGFPNFGIYRPSSSGTVEFQSGDYHGNSFDGGGAVLVSGANVFSGFGGPFSGTFNVVGGALQLNHPYSNVGSIIISGGSFGGSGSVNTSRLDWKGGSIGGGNGTLTVNGYTCGSPCFLTNPNAIIENDVDHYLVSPYNLTFRGLTDWSNGRLHALAPSSSGDTFRIINENFGAAGNGIFRILANRDFVVDPGSGSSVPYIVFDNAGAVDKTGFSTPGQTIWQAPLFNNSQVNVDLGTLTLTGGDGVSLIGFPNFGIYRPSSSGTIEFQSGVYNGNSFDGGGAVLVSGANVFSGFGGPFSGTFNVVGGALQLNHPYAGVGSIIVSGGSFGGSGSVNTNRLDWKGGSIGGGNGTLTVNGYTCSSPCFLTNPNAIIENDVDHYLVSPYNLTFRGLTDWSNGRLHALAPSSSGDTFRIINENFGAAGNGIFRILANRDFVVDPGSGSSVPYIVFDNAGAVDKTGFSTPGQTIWQAPLFNNSQVNVDLGTLTLTGGDGVSLIGFPNFGIYRPSSSGTIEFQSGVYNGNSFDGGGAVLVSGANVFSGFGGPFSGTFNVVGGALQLNHPYSGVGSIIVSGGSFGGSGSVNTNRLDWKGGSIGGGNGTLTVNGYTCGSPCFLTNPNAIIENDVDHYLVSPYNLTFRGLTDWSNGRLHALAPSSSGDTFRIINENFGAAGNGIFRILANRDFVVDPGSGSSVPYIVFDNAGAVDKTGFSTPGQTIWQAPLFNNSQVNVDLGTLTLTGGDGVSLIGFPNFGIYRPSSSGTIEFQSGVYNGNSFDGGGAVLVSGANVFSGFGGPFSGTFNVVGGALQLNHPYAGVGSIIVSGGSFGGSGSVNTNRLDWKGGSIGGGNGTLTVNACSAACPSTPNAIIENDVDHYLASPYTLTLNGHTDWTNGRLHALTPGSGADRFTINNFAGGPTGSGTFEILTNRSFVVDAGFGGAPYIVFDNGGFLEKQAGGGAGTTMWQAPLFNNYHIDINAGTLTLTGGDGVGLVGFPGFGDYRAHSPGTVEFRSRAYSNLGFDGDGTVLVSGATVNTGFGGPFSGTFNVSAGALHLNNGYGSGMVDISGGSFGGSGTVNTNNLDWQGGSIGGGNGTLTVNQCSAACPSTPNAIIENDVDHNLVSPYTLTLNGHTAWTNGRLHALTPASAGDTFTINNFAGGPTGSGTFEILANRDFVVDPGLSTADYIVFDNGGFLDKEAGGGAGPTIWQAPLFNNYHVDVTAGTLTLTGGDGMGLIGFPAFGEYRPDGAGSTIEFQSGVYNNISFDGTGTVLVSGANVFVNSMGPFTGTVSLTGGSLTISSAFTNAGTVQLISGTLQTASFTNAGTLSVTIAGTTAGTDFGQLITTGDINLGGTLTAASASGFTPVAGSSYLFATAGGAVNGNFAVTNTGPAYTPVVEAADVKLTA